MNKNQNFLLIYCCLLILTTIGCQTTLTVKEVISADTIILSNGQTVRYAGVTAPEKDSVWFEYTRIANAYLVQNHKVQLVEEPDLSNGDVVHAYVYTPIQDGEKERQLFVNAELIKFGYAKTKPLPANAKHKELWQNLIDLEENEAKPYQLGIWSQHAPPQNFNP